MADKKRLITIHTPVRINSELAAVLAVIAEQYKSPVAELRNDGLAIYLDRWSQLAP